MVKQEFSKLRLGVRFSHPVPHVAIVYRLTHKVFILARRVQLPLAMPINKYNIMEPVTKISSWTEKPYYKDTFQKFKEFYKKSKPKEDKEKVDAEKEKEDNLIGWA